jgi:outer membrane immunogenic protein
LGLGYDGSRFKNKTYSASLPGGTTQKIKPRSTSKLTYNIVGRVGYAFPSVLAYVKVGYEGRSKINGSISSISRNGVLLGLGLDYAATQNIFLRAEYTYNFGSRKKISGDDVTLTIRTPTKTILIGAGYKF